MHPGPGRRSAHVLPWHPPARAGGDDGPQHGYIPGVKVYNHNFCCTEQGRRLALHCNGGNFPRANLRDLEKPPQGTCGSFALLSFSEQSQTSLQLESPVAVLQTLTKPALLGSKATTNFLPNGSCQAAKMPAVGLDQRLSAKPTRKMCQATQENGCNCTCNSAASTRNLQSAGSEGCPGQTTPLRCTSITH